MWPLGGGVEAEAAGAGEGGGAERAMLSRQCYIGVGVVVVVVVVPPRSHPLVVVVVVVVVVPPLSPGRRRRRWPQRISSYGARRHASFSPEHVRTVRKRHAFRIRNRAFYAI